MGDQQSRDLICVVDDDPSALDLACRFLQRGGYESQPFPDGESFLDALAGERVEPSMLLLDYHMQGLNGFDVLKTVRASHSKDELPVVMVTADANPSIIVAALESGANDYITKPYNAKVLCARITTQLQLAQALRQSRQSADEERKRNIEKSEFLALLTHELKTPLHQIGGFADLIANNAQTTLEHCRAHAQMILDCNKRMTSLVDDLLLLSSFDLGRAVVREEEGPLSALINDAVDMCHLRCVERRVNIDVSCAPDIMFSGDQKKMRNALAKLVDNAVKFSPKGGACKVEAEMRPEHHVRVRVTDTGAGMDTENLSIALQPYKQGSGGLSRSHEGLGIGLPLAQFILALHGASLDIKSEVGTGAVVDVIIPPERVAA